MSARRYVYRPLDTNQSVIRTMRLKRASAESDLVQCEIDVTMLNDGEERGGPGVSYEALSYTWGDASAAPRHILVGGDVLPVTANLHRALVHLRRPTHDRLLWVDAVCIDQGNPHERTHQVDLMKRIYGQAEMVLIWLGPATIESCVAMPYLLQVDQAVLGSGRRLDLPDAWRDEFERSGQGGVAASVAHHMLPALFESPWFRRIWVIQEAASAKAALVMYGHDAVPARTFAMVSTLPSVRIPEGARAALEVMPGPLKKTSWWRDSRDLLTLLCKFANYEATDPRDKVYALLGISERAEGEPQIKADYGAAEVEVRRQVNMLIASRLFYNPPILHREVCRHIGDYADPLPGSVDQIITSFFHWAVESERLGLATALVREMPDLNPNAHTPYHGPPLCMLVKRGSHDGEDVARALLEHPNIEVNVTFKGNTPLNLAMSMRNIGMIEVLAARKDADIWSVGADGLYPLQAAMLDGQSLEPAATAAAEAFIQRSRIWKNESTMELIAEAFPEMLKRIEQCRAKVCWHSRQLWKEINSEQENIELIEKYIREGADVNYPINDNSFITPLVVAASKGSMTTVEMLLAKGADPNPSAGRGDPYFRSPLWEVVAACHTNVVRLLLDAGADPNWGAGYRCGSCLQVAVEKGYVDITFLLRVKGAIE